MALRRNLAAPPPSANLRRAKIALAVVAPLVLAAALLHTSRTIHEVCAVCYSSRSTSNAGFGTDPAAPWWETDRHGDLRTSRACTEFFDGACPHRWERFSTRVSVFFLMSIGGGTLPPQPLAQQYEHSPRFRELVAKRVAAGEWSADEFRAACGVPAEPGPGDLADPARLALLRRGAALLREGGERNSGRRWEAALAAAPEPPR